MNVTPGSALRLAAAAAVVVLGAACSDDGGGRGEDGRVEEPSSISAYELRAGDCTNPPDEVGTEVGSVTVVPCDEPHTQEIFALVPYTDEDGEVPDGRASFPGDEPLSSFSQAACIEPFSDYFDVDYVDSSLFITYLFPSVRSWDEEDDREIVCIAQTTGEPVSESLAGDGR